MRSDSTEVTSAQPVSALTRKFAGAGSGYRWKDLPIKEYKSEGAHFQGITRQVLFGTEHGLPAELRYFEVEPEGYSTLERHEHEHAVLILQGKGRAVIGETVTDLAAHDLVHVPAQTWHQFLAAEDAPLGFLCLVASDRDRPVRPSPEEASCLQAHPVIGNAIRL